MAWIKVESSVARNRKFVKAGPASSWLWLCGLAYCQEGLTDGFIPSEAIDYLGVHRARHMAKHLVSAGLWAAVDGGWEVHDYLEHNRPASEVRRIQRERQDAGANGGKASGEARRKQVASIYEASDEANPKQAANPSTATATTSATPEALGSAVPTAKDAVGRARGMAPLHDTSHKKHVHCGRVCVHSSQHDAFVRRRNHLQADQELRDFYSVTDDEWSEPPLDTVEPGDPFDFWRDRYAERWPATVKAVARRAAEQQPVHSEWICPHVEEHLSRWRCDQATQLNKPRKVPA